MSAEKEVDESSLFYIDTLMKYHGFDTDKMDDKQWALTFWTLADIRKKESGI